MRAKLEAPKFLLALTRLPQHVSKMSAPFIWIFPTHPLLFCVSVWERELLAITFQGIFAMSQVKDNTTDGQAIWTGLHIRRHREVLHSHSS